jgi:hypothetical protein
MPNFGVPQQNPSSGRQHSMDEHVRPGGQQNGYLILEVKHNHKLLSSRWQRRLLQCQANTSKRTARIILMIDMLVKTGLMDHKQVMADKMVHGLVLQKAFHLNRIAE